MAREFARVAVSIWSSEFRALTGDAQRLYMALLTSPSLSHVGVADYRPNRIAAYCSDWARADVEKAAAELEEALFLVVDEDTEEVLIRSFLRHDGLMKQPKMATAMATAFTGVASRGIRGVLVHELRRLREEQPELAGWRSDQALDVLASETIDPRSYPCRKGSVMGCDDPSPDDTPKGSGDGSSNPSREGSRKGSGNPNPKGSAKGWPTPAPTPTALLPPPYLGTDTHQRDDGGGGGTPTTEPPEDPPSGSEAVDDLRAELRRRHPEVAWLGMGPEQLAEVTTLLIRLGSAAMLARAGDGALPRTAVGWLARWREMRPAPVAKPLVRCKEHGTQHLQGGPCAGCVADQLAGPVTA